MPKLKPNYMVEKHNDTQSRIKKEQKEKEETDRLEKLKQIDEIEKNIRKKDTSTFTGAQFQDDLDDMPDLE